MSILCTHTNQTTPRRDREGEYRRCLDCGRRVPWEWKDGEFPPPRLTQPGEDDRQGAFWFFSRLFTGDHKLSVAERMRQ